MAKLDIFAAIQDSIVLAMETAQAGDWEQSWIPAGLGRASNAITGARYQGANAWILADECHWATYKQWNAAGYQVKKGESGMHCVKWCPKIDKETGKVDYLIPSAFVVFHAGQLTESFVPANLELKTHSADAVMSEIVAASGVRLQHVAGNSAHYRPADDTITMPLIGQFESANAYSATLAHELAHWTGHRSRLDRLKTGGDVEDYAAEELVAELASAFIMGALGLSTEPRADHAQYLNAWIAHVKSDKTAFTRACTKAQAAANYLLAYSSAFAKPEAEAEAA